MAESDDPDSLPTQSWVGREELPTAPESGVPAATPNTGSRRGGWEPPAPEEIQPRFPQYEIASVLGRGGMGAVYKCWQKRLGRFVAIKILRPDLEDDTGDFARRFEREAKAMARLSHPGIVSVFDAGETGGLVYFIMEYVEGADVYKLVAGQGRLSPEMAGTITSRVCEALAYAHENGVIHRDIKPSNVMVDARGRVKVADFGLAKVVTEASALLTSTHVRMGTPDFMAPEAMMGGDVDQRADLYAVGVMLYQMLTGELPRGRFELPSHRVSGLDVRFDKIIDHALQTDPGKRYSSAADILTDLRGIVSDPLRQAPTAVAAAGMKLAPGADATPNVKAAPKLAPAPNLKLAPAHWTPSLREFLRVRRKLTPVEALRLGHQLGKILDEEHSHEAPKRALLIHGIAIVFRESLSEGAARAKLRENVTEWPPFDLTIDASKNPAEGETIFLDGAETLITAGDLAGDRVQQLGRVIYELLGGVAGSRFSPLAALGDEGNEVLRRGVTEGLKAFPRARDLIAELREAAADEQAGQPAAPRPEAAVPPPKKVIPSPGRARSAIPAVVIAAMAFIALAAFGWMKYGSHGKSTVSATREAPFVNSLGMQFVPAGKTGGPTSGVLFSVWDTRVQDYAVYAREKNLPLMKPLFEQGPFHPVVMVNWTEARGFCVWLTDRERGFGLIGRGDRYRLPSGDEWSYAVGIGTVEKAEGLADARSEAVYPWGKQWPPPKGAGNYAGDEFLRAERGAPKTNFRVLTGYEDGYVHTAPVGMFSANRYGLYDMGGNVWQWCEDELKEDEQKRTRALRGGSWRIFDPVLLRSSYRNLARPEDRSDDVGFRCVLVVAGG